MNKKKKASPAQLKALARGRKIRAANIKKRKRSGVHLVKPTKRRATSKAKKTIKRKKRKKTTTKRYTRVKPYLYNFKRYN